MSFQKTRRTQACVKASDDLMQNGYGYSQPFSNYSNDVPLGIDQICKSLRALTNGWPKCVSGMLVALRGEALEPIKRPAELFAWIAGFGQIDWKSGSRAVTKEEFFCRLSNTERWAWSTPHPHFPSVDDVLYLKCAPSAKNSGALDRLLDFFEPKLAEDREMIRAMVLTVFWGGPPGARPQFVIAAEEGDDPDAGRGVGKTTLAQVVGDLAGGCIDIDPSGNRDRFSTNLLSPEALKRRVALIDNLKTSRFSSDLFEKLITRNEITGHRLYEGYETRPNLLTWIVTVNGPSFSTDMAHRSIPIFLKRPERPKPGWEGMLRDFLTRNRDDLLADIRWHIEVKEGSPTAFARWAEWGSAVLGKCERPKDVLRCIQERRQLIDADKEEVCQAIEHIGRCIDLHFRKDEGFADRVRVFAPTAWLAKALISWRSDMTERQSQVFLKRLVGTDRLRMHRRKSYRGYIWIGKDVVLDDDDQLRLLTIEYCPNPPR